MSVAPDRRPTAAPASGLQLVIDYLPLLVFFIVNFVTPGDLARDMVGHVTGTLGEMTRLEAIMVARVIVATSAFVVATALVMVFSLVKLGRISAMLWISGGLVIVFGGLTLYFHDPRFIQMKPTFVYVVLAALLGFGLATGRPLMQQVLGGTYPGLDALGWRKLTINWCAFFAGLAIANEIARHLLTLDQWVLFKFPGCAAVTFFFAIANVPMLLRHGLMVEDGPAGEQRAATGQLPPE
ncbi:MAG: inner membrane-spanning protein YciB [Janthinobacterium lividum]